MPQQSSDQIVRVSRRAQSTGESRSQVVNREVRHFDFGGMLSPRWAQPRVRKNVCFANALS